MKALVIFTLSYIGFVNTSFSQADTTNTLTAESLCTGVGTYLNGLIESNFTTFMGREISDDGFQKRFLSIVAFPGLNFATIGDTNKRSSFRSSILVLGQDTLVNGKPSDRLIEAYKRLCPIMDECMAYYKFVPDVNQVQSYDYQQPYVLNATDNPQDAKIRVLLGIVKQPYPEAYSIEVRIWVR